MLLAHDSSRGISRMFVQFEQLTEAAKRFERNVGRDGRVYNWWRYRVDDPEFPSSHIGGFLLSSPRRKVMDSFVCEVSVSRLLGHCRGLSY